MLKHILVWILLGVGSYYYWTNRPVEHGPGVVAPDTPNQEMTFHKENINHKGFKLISEAKISFEARVLSIKNYYFDKFSDLTQTDVVFGWGPMSDERNLNSVMVRQSNRSFYWEMNKPPIAQNKMWIHAANMHLIASTTSIQEKINSLRKGHIVKVKGQLVNAQSPKGWELETSLTREDIGDDSSELVWIKSLTIL